MTTATTPNEPGTPAEGAPGGIPVALEKGESVFTQADVDRIVKERAERIAKQRYPDYDDLKAKAGESQTLEQRIADMETRTAKAEADALRATVAAEYGISAKKGPNGEPSDADLFLTGSDEATLTAQAQRLAGREVERKKQGNFAPKEGTTPSAVSDDSLRDFTKKLFNKE